MGVATLIKGVHFVRKLTSKGITWYVYAYRSGPCVLKSKGPTKPKLGRNELSKITKALAEKAAPDPDTLSSLIRKWRLSPEWNALAANTKKTWGSALNRVEEKWGSVPLRLFNETRMIEKIVNWRDSRKATPRAADLGVDVLKALLRYGVERGLLMLNVAAGIRKLYKGAEREEIIWTEDDMRRFGEVALQNGLVHVWDALRFGAATGFRRDDLVTVDLSQISRFAIVKKAKKRSRGRRRFTTMPRIPELGVLLDELATRDRAEGVTTVLVAPDGRPWHPDTLTKAVAKVRDLAGIVHLDEETGERRQKHLHDVRGTFATKLMAQTDLNDQEIADIMGWSPQEVARIRKVYVDQRATIVAIGQRIARGVNPEGGP